MKNINEIFEAASFISQELIIKADFFSGGVFAFKNQVTTPRKYLQWAKKNSKDKSEHGRSDGINNVKKSIELVINQNLKSLNISVGNDNVSKFLGNNVDLEEGGNTKTKLIAALGIAPSILISDIWNHRNDAEHEFIIPPYRTVKQAIEVAELLILSNDKREERALTIEFRDIRIESLEKNYKDPFRLKPIPTGIVFSWTLGEEKTLFKLQYDEFKEGKYQSYIYEFTGVEYEFLLLIKASFCDKTYDREVFENTITEFLNTIYKDSFKVREFQYNDPQFPENKCEKKVVSE